MQQTDTPAHDRAILDQFTRQAEGFAARPALHSDAVLDLIVAAAALGAGDRAIDLACGTGSVVCALAARAAQVVGIDMTDAMLDQARKRATEMRIANVEWRRGSIYAAPYDDGTFDAVTCRFAFHHLEDPAAAFAEMLRLAAPGGRIVLCDGLASDDPDKARAFNAMERWRDPSTVAFRTLDDLSRLFSGSGLGQPGIRTFDLPYLAAELVDDSFPEDGDRVGLLAAIEASVADDALGMGAEATADGVRIAYHSVILSAVKPR
jgi:SAM-dependent methyltransferase